MIVSKMTQEEKGYGRSYNLYRNFLTWTFVQVFSKTNKSNKKYFFHPIRQTCLFSSDFTTNIKKKGIKQ